MIKRSLFRKISLLACCALLFCSFFSHAHAQTDPTIRVYLKRLQIEDTLYIRVQGDYMLEGGSMSFRDGTEIAIALRDGQLVLHHNGIAVVMGKNMTLLRCDGEVSGALYLNGSSGAYEGDLHLDILDDAIRAVLYIHIEDYLLGVVPFEMGDSFPLEALKAQAIAARTYALSQTGSSDAYDVEDTTNDQAYRGRTTNSPLSEQAIYETAGQCGTYKGKLAQCYYSASNGGQTELGQHVWPSEDLDRYGYMDMRDDPYDYENEASSVKRYILKKKPSEAGIGAALHQALVEALAQQLTEHGIEVQADLIRIDEIISLVVDTPKFDEPSRLMTQMVFQLKLSVRDCLYRDPGIPAASETPSASPEATHAPSPTATPAYSPYRAIDEVLTVTLPIFNSAEKAMGLSINVYQNELISVTDIGTSFMIESRRFGHGVGMSQRGAQQMAEKYGMTCEQILSFYYPLLEVKTYTWQAHALPKIDAELMSTPAPSPSPTPRPTLMPVSTSDMPKGAYLATVANIAEDSSLNLRESSSLSADILRRLYKDQQLIVLSVSSDGWAHVRTDVIEGYVKNEYLQTVQE